MDEGDGRKVVLVVYGSEGGDAGDHGRSGKVYWLPAGGINSLLMGQTLCSCVYRAEKRKGRERRVAAFLTRKAQKWSLARFVTDFGLYSI